MNITVAIIFGPLAFGIGLTYTHFLDVVSSYLVYAGENQIAHRLIM